MQQRSFRGYAAAILAMISLLAVNAAAQLTTGKVEGTVRDKDTGQPLEGTQVVIEGTRMGNVTNKDGYYFILSVPPGPRDVTFTFTGYQKTTVTNTLILAGQTTTVDAALSSTVVQLEGITVQGETEVLMPRDNTVTKQRLTAERISEIPAQRLEDMMILEAGVDAGGRDAMGRGLRIRGGRLGEEAMVVDGVMVRNYTADPFRQGQGWIFDEEVGSRSEDTTPLEFSTASIEQVDIITGGFQAEYGNAQSGIINIVTKEGGPDLRGNVRWTTDGVMPRTSDWGYNQLTASIGGPIPLVPNLYFHVSGEVQAEKDRSYSHADEGFRGVNQDFIDRLNNSIRNDPFLGSLATPPFSLEAFRMGHESYVTRLQQDFPELYDANSPLHQMTLFTPFNPARNSASNWGDRTLGTGKITYSPISSLKFISSVNRSRNQYGYPNGWEGEGNYFQTGLFYKGDPVWAARDWGADTVLHVWQNYARKTRTSNLLVGADWEIFRSAERSAALQFRYTWVKAVENNNSSIADNWERNTFLGYAVHDVQYQIEHFPNREFPTDVKMWADGAVGWKMGVEYENPFRRGDYTAYYYNYFYLKEQQDNFKADMDLQLNRYNRAKLGFQLTSFTNLAWRIDYRYVERLRLNEFGYQPQIWSGYAQNRTDLGDFVIDYGVRYDGFSPRANWSLSPTDLVGEDVHPKVKTIWSPRFDVAFPVTDKAQLRFNYGVFAQLPGMTQLFSGGNQGDLGYAKTDAFEAGLSYLLTQDMVLDLVSYYRDVTGNVANKRFFYNYWAWNSQEQRRGWSTSLVNRDSGNIKGVDLVMRKRFSNNFAYNLSYTLSFSRTTGSAYNTGTLATDPATGEGYVPPDELSAMDNDQTHKFAFQLNHMFPDDYRSGTLLGKVLKNLRSYAVVSLQSGEPLLYVGSTGDYIWTRADDPSLTSQVRGFNFFRGRWYYNLDLRFSKIFAFGAARKLNFFGEVYNVVNRKNNVAYPSGVTYEGYDNVTGGVDLKWENMAAGNFNMQRFNADFNQDGVLTVYEAALGAIAEGQMDSTMDKRRWGLARRIRFGLEFTF
ncbi:MAG: carboxypeptidase regulatory-like domain-containing protein [Candidatus Glassbacteria bacterium]